MTDHRQLPDALEQLRSQLTAAAAREQTKSRRWMRRPLWPTRTLSRIGVLVSVAIVVAGTATAAVVATRGTTDLDGAATPRAPAVANLDGVLAALRSTASAVNRSPLTGEHGTVRGLTVSHAGITVDVSADDQDICFAHRTSDRPTGESACSSLPVSTTGPPFQIGRNDGRTWLTAIVPDGTTDFAITGHDGSTADATVINNVAVAVLPRVVEIESLAWRTADGEVVTQKPGEAPVTAP